MPGDVKLGSAFVELGSKLSSDFGDALDAARAQIEGLSGAANRLGKSLTLAGAAITGPLTIAANLFQRMSKESNNSPLFSESSARIAKTLGEAFMRLAFAGKLIAVAIGSALGQSIADTVNKTALLVARFAKWISDNPKLISQVFELGKVLGGAGVALVAISKTLAVLAVLFSPAGVIGIAIVGVLALLEVFGLLDTGVIDVGKSFIKTIGDFRVGGLQIRTHFTIMTNKIIAVWERVKTKIAGVWDSMISTGKIAMTKLVKFIGVDTVKKISDMFFDLGDVILSVMEPVLNFLQPVLAKVQQVLGGILRIAGVIDDIELKEFLKAIDENKDPGTRLRSQLEDAKKGAGEFIKGFDPDKVIEGIKKGLAARDAARDALLDKNIKALTESSADAVKADRERAKREPKGPTMESLLRGAKETQPGKDAAGGAGVLGSFANIGITAQRGFALQTRQVEEAVKQTEVLKNIDQNTKNSGAKFTK